MTCVDAFLGQTDTQISSLPQYSATGFSEPGITPDINALQNHPVVKRLERGIAISNNKNTFEAAVFSFISALDQIKARMKKLVQNGIMNDGNTQLVVDMLAVLKILVGKITDAYPNGIPISATRKAEDIIGEIDDYARQLIERRKKQFYASKRPAHYRPGGKSPAQQFREGDPSSGTGAPGGGVPGEAADIVDTGVPGGGASGKSGDTIDTNGAPAGEQTAMQKYGPALALVGGGIAAYLALR